ncbi:MAG: pantoate--beta-alanine ligase, partial [Cyanobacteria bacterium P01_D01_bin.128]
MRLLKTIEGLRCYLAQLRQGQPIDDPDQVAAARLTVGLVPTMGALHPGHISLIRRAKGENDRVVVSIFVNPLQFGPREDLERYPRRLEADRQICEAEGVDVVFAPAAEALYPSETHDSSEPNNSNGLEPFQVLPPKAMLQTLCGEFRPGHFEGVATVVTKLLNLIRPDRAYFGRKDAQQLAILRQLIVDLNLPGEIVPCKTVREADGLAYSSRNQYLQPQERQQAAGLYRSLQEAEARFRRGDRDRIALINAVKTCLDAYPLLQAEYIELVHPHTLV